MEKIKILKMWGGEWGECGESVTGKFFFVTILRSTAALRFDTFTSYTHKKEFAPRTPGVGA
jgi:hypothetical protein